MRVYDAHCHLHEFSTDEVRKLGDCVIVAVSDDYESTLKSLELAKQFSYVIPCAGVHPWQVGGQSASVLEDFKRLVSARDEVRCLGEVGLDKRFAAESYEKQLEFFKFFLSLAKEYALIINAHALDAWREVLDLLLKFDVSKAVIHWYSGPVELLEDIEGAGFFVTVNPSVDVQQRHMRAALEVDVKCLLTESDGPYLYRGRRLGPSMIPRSLGLLAERRGMSAEELAGAVEANFYRAFGEALRRI